MNDLFGMQAMLNCGPVGVIENSFTSDNFFLCPFHILIYSN
jgi:hypothetical protein